MYDLISFDINIVLQARSSAEHNNSMKKNEALFSRKSVKNGNIEIPNLTDGNMGRKRCEDLMGTDRAHQRAGQIMQRICSQTSFILLTLNN